MGGISLGAYRGNIVIARSTSAANIPLIRSGAALTILEDVKAAGPLAWFQAYTPGGRQLDDAVAPLRVLPGIVNEAGDMAIMIDSGIRRDTDVLKALALGAKFAFVSRPFLYAASIAGDEGVVHAIRILRGEIHRDRALLGVNTIAEVTRERLVRAHKFDSLASNIT